MKTFTRQQYMNKECSHAEFFQPFAEAWLRAREIPESIMARVRVSKDPHLNDIPLQEWDRLWGAAPQRGYSVQVGMTFHASIPPRVRELVREAGETLSPSTLTCIVKRAAEIQRDREKSS